MNLYKTAIAHRIKVMSGHSKWTQIKHRKEASDHKKGQIFSKLSRKISIAAKEGPDPSMNYKLQATVDEAHAANMPKENIERAIKKASEKDSATLDSITVQALGPASVAIIIEAITDNKNRTIGEIKNILAKNDAKMAAEGSLNWMFDRKGVIMIRSNSPLSEDIEMRVIEGGAEDIKQGEGLISIITPPEKLGEVRKSLAGSGLKIESSDLEMIPRDNLDITNEAIKQKIEKLLEELDSQDDVQNIFSNF